MPSKIKIHFRTLLMVLVSIALMPGVLVVVYAWSVAQDEARLRATAEIAAVTKLLVRDQEQWVDEAKAMLNTVASGPSVRRSDMRPICNDFLTNLRGSSAKYLDIGFADLQGMVQCQARLPQGAAPIAPHDTGKASKERVAIGGPYRAASGKRALDFSKAVENDAGVVVGVAYLTLDLDYINRQINLFAMSQPMRIVVQTPDGAILAESSTIRQPSSLPSPRLAATGQQASWPWSHTPASDATVERWMVATELVRNSGPQPWLATVSVREKDALANSQSHFEKQLLFVLLASLAGCMLAAFFARQVLEKPVTRLIARMRRVKDGSATSPSSLTLNVELSELDAVFSQMLENLNLQQQQLITAQEITQVGFFELDLQSMTSAAPAITYKILGLDPVRGPISLEEYQSLIHPEDRVQVAKNRAEALAGGQPFHMQHRIIRPDNAVRWLNSHGFVRRDAQGRAITYYGALQDITDLKTAELEALATEKRFRLLFENSLDGVLQVTMDGDVLLANTAACKIFGLSEHALKQAGRRGLADLDDPRLYSFLSTRDELGCASGQLTMVRGDGERFEAEVSSSAYVDATQIPCASVVIRDVTQRIAHEKQIHDLAFFDPLTALPNRRMLLDRLESHLTAVGRHAEVGAVMFVDLDNFKNVNDARGHATGDALLKLVAHRLAALVRAEDTVARLGGDEFVIILPRLATQRAEGMRHALSSAEKLHAVLTEPFLVNDHSYTIACSIGITLFSHARQSTADLLREADTAMYRAKSTGRNRIVFYETAMQSEAEQRLGIENDLALAIGTDQLKMAIQLQVDHHGAPTGCELLMRWTHPQHGVMSPEVFISVAEESGLILRMGDWVIQQGCATVSRLRQAGFAMPVSVNVSPRQFRQPDFVERVARIIAQSDAPASSLIFEITEGLLIEDVDDTITRMHALIDLGVRFSIDDFGTGYSSLSYLQRLPLFELKIDHSFVRDIPGAAGPTALVQSILSMSAHLGLRVVAEGVETQEQADFLIKAGCESLQGFLFCRPTTLESWLDLQRSTTTLG